VLRGRRVLLAVTGGVAAYKSAYLARRLMEAGAELEVILTDSATEFVGAQTFAAITGKRPHGSLFESTSVSPHTELARWCDAVVVAPATAATLARIANGISSDLLSATLLATQSPVLLAPAMHTEMWEHPATRRNIETLRDDGYRFVGPEEGDLAGGDIGVGRVSEPEQIIEALGAVFDQSGRGRRFLVTAGGTREPIDPVRFLGNRSSGKMGHEIADAAARRGFETTLVTTSDLPALPSVKVVHVETAEEMQTATSNEAADVAVLAAAVADFRPKDAVPEKVSRSEGMESVQLESTPDILASIVERTERPFVVGFAAETGGVDRAIEKARRKKVDLLVYNNVTEPGSSFGSDTNQVAIIDSDGATDQWPLMSKRDVAEKLIDLILSEMEDVR
jgi:phosphopantothenoylcysteine decarboxylase/phosphopantothenate--cysteine ligase